jgi:hypothetical protein
LPLFEEPDGMGANALELGAEMLADATFDMGEEVTGGSAADCRL